MWFLLVRYREMNMNARRILSLGFNEQSPRLCKFFFLPFFAGLLNSSVNKTRSNELKTRNGCLGCSIHAPFPAA